MDPLKMARDRGKMDTVQKLTLEEMYEDLRKIREKLGRLDWDDETSSYNYEFGPIEWTKERRKRLKKLWNDFEEKYNSDNHPSFEVRGGGFNFFSREKFSIRKRWFTHSYSESLGGSEGKQEVAEITKNSIRIFPYPLEGDEQYYGRIRDERFFEFLGEVKGEILEE